MKFFTTPFLLMVLLSGALPANTTAVFAQPAAFSFSADSKQRQQAYLKFIEARRLKGEAQRINSRSLLEDAIRAFRETIQLDPNSAEPHVDLGEIYFFFLNQPTQAEREAQEAIRLDPKGVSGHLLMARLRIFTARSDNNVRPALLDRAIAAYEKVAELDQKNAEAWAFLSELYGMKNQTDKQIPALEKWAGAPVPTEQFFYQTMMSAELTPDRAYYQLSQIYLGQSRTPEAPKAVDAARRAYEMNPEVGDYARNLISILRVAGNSADETRILGQLFKTANSPVLLIGYGSALIRAGRYNEAIERLRDFAAADAENAGAVGLLALAQRRAGQRKAAVDTLKTALAKIESDPRTDLMLELAQTYEELNRNEEAVTEYEKAFEIYTGKNALTPANTPLFNEIVNRLAIIFRRAGNQTKLQALLARTRRLIDEHNPLVDLLTIENLREDGKRREALEMTRAAIRRYPDDHSLKYTEALILSDLKRPDESAELLRSLLKGRPDDTTEDAGIYLLISGVYLQHGKLKEAEEAARKSINLNPDDPESTVRLSSVLEKTGQHAAAEKALRDLLRQHPDNSVALNNLGYFLLEHGNRQQEALALIEQAVAIEPINGSFLDSLGWAQFKLGQTEKAKESLEKALIYSRRNATANEHLGDVLQRLGRVAEARRHWEKALELSLEDVEIARLKVKLKDRR
ncbi:MAG: tetratricopeptide repeat protein [Acidobacteriota bacterium]